MNSFILSMLDVPRQLKSERHRARCLATLRAGDVVQAICRETGHVLGTRLLDAVDNRRELGGGTREDWPQRYVAGDWHANDEGEELDEAQFRVPFGWVLVRPPLTHQEAQHLLNAPVPLKPAFTWARYEKHMQATHEAVLAGLPVPEVPWA